MIRSLAVSLAILFMVACHHEHAHDVVEIKAVVDGKKAAIEFEAGGDAFFGIAEAPANKEEEQILEQARDQFIQNLPSAIAFTGDQSCTFSSEEPVQFEESGHHHHAALEVIMDCAQPISGSVITFQFKSSYDEVNKVNIELTAAGLEERGLSAAGGTFQFP